MPGKWQDANIVQAKVSNGESGEYPGGERMGRDEIEKEEQVARICHQCAGINYYRRKSSLETIPETFKRRILAHQSMVRCMYSNSTRQKICAKPTSSDKKMIISVRVEKCCAMIRSNRVDSASRSNNASNAKYRREDGHRC